MVCTTSRILDYSQISNLSTGLFRLKEDSKMDCGTKLDGFHSSTDASLFSSSLPVMIHEKLKLDDNKGNGWAVNTKSSLVNELHQGSAVLDQAELMDGRNLPDEDDLLAAIADDFDFNELPRQVEDLDDDLFSSGGGLELDFDPQENGNTKTPTFPDSFFGNGTTYGISSGIGTLPGEHPFGEHPSRTLFVRNINSNVEDTELRTLFEQYGTIRTLYTACKHRGFVMISYYDIRAARSAMRSLQNKPLRRRKLDIHFSIPKDNPTDKDMNQGTLVVFNLDPSVSNEDLLHIFGAFGEVKEIRETPHKKHHKFIEFYDVRAADAALRHLNRSDIAGKRIKLEPSRPGGARRSMMQQMSNESEHDGVYRPQVGSPMNNSPPGGWTNFGSPTEDGSFQSIHHSVGIGNINSVHRSLPGLAAIVPPMVSAPAKVVTEGPRPNSVDALPVTSMGTGAPIHLPHSFSENGSMFNATRYGSPVTGPGPVHGISTPYGSHGAIGIPNAAPFGQSKSSSIVGTPSPQQFQWSAQPAYHVQNSAWPRPFNGNARPQQQSYGFSGRHPSYMNHVMAPHHHHVGSAPSGEPLHHGYFTDSPDPSFMHPRSFNGMGFVNGSPMMNMNGFGFPNNGVAENGSPNFPIRSPQHMSHMHLAGGPPGSVNNYGDGQTERGRSRRGENLANQLDNKKQYQLDLDKIIGGEDTRTTLMIKNIPNKYTSKMLLAAIDEHHRGTYDFLYLPIDFKNKCNVGYAFLNMTSPNHIISFYKAFNGKKWEKFNSEKVASIAYARIQGKAALVTHFQNSSLMNEDKRCRPILFHPEGTEVGDQEPFPLTINHMVRPSESPLNEDHCNDQESQIGTDKASSEIIKTTDNNVAILEEEDK